MPATAADINKFAIARSNNFNFDLTGAPELADYEIFELCPTPDFRPGLEKLFYHIGGFCWIGHSSATFTWEELPAIDYERMLYVYNSARPNYNPTTVALAGTSGRGYCCYQNAYGVYVLTGCVFSEPKGTREGAVVKNVMFSIAKMGLQRYTYNLIGGGLGTAAYWYDQLDALQYEYGKSSFAPPVRRDFIFGTGEQDEV